jgi:hypothetical protein
MTLEINKVTMECQADEALNVLGGGCRNAAGI